MCIRDSSLRNVHHYIIEKRKAQVFSGEFSMNFCFAPSLSCPCSCLLYTSPDLILAVEFLIHRLVGCVEPEHFVERCPVLRGKAAVEPRCAVARDERRLDGDGAAAAEGIAERVTAIVVRELDHRGGERFLEGGRHAVGAVAALVKAPVINRL